MRIGRAMVRIATVLWASCLITLSASLLACAGCWNAEGAGARSETDSIAPSIESVAASFELSDPPEAATVRPLVAYLTATVAPCDTRLGGDADTCAPFEIPDSSTSDAAHLTFGTNPLKIDDVIADTLLGLSESSTTHLLIRGVWIPETVRCELYPFVIGHKSSFERPVGSYETKCFRDFAVSSYIFGQGPDRVTLIWGGGYHSANNFSSRDELEKLSEKSAEETIRSVNAEHPREWILTLIPTFDNVAHSSWRGDYSFYVERDAGGEPVVASTWLDFYRVEGFEIVQEHLDQFTWTLEEFERRASEFHDNRPTMEGPNWASNHRIVTDIYDIHNFHVEDLKPYWEPRGIIPAPPPAAPGEPHSYPPVLAVESETGTEKLTLMEPSVEPVGSE